METRSPTFCHTFTGAGFDALNLAASPEPVLEDIAHHLAMRCRFGGATPVFYSVAQHSVNVARAAFVAAGGDPVVGLLALGHDNAEAYLPDVARPHKDDARFWIPGYTYHASFEDVEAGVLEFIHRTLLPVEVYTVWKGSAPARQWVADADDSVLHAEFRGLFPASTWPDDNGPPPLQVAPITPADCQDWKEAKAGYLRAHAFYLREIRAQAARAAVDPSPFPPGWHA